MIRVPWNLILLLGCIRVPFERILSTLNECQHAIARTRRYLVGEIRMKLNGKTAIWRCGITVVYLRTAMTVLVRSSISEIRFFCTCSLNCDFIPHTRLTGTAGRVHCVRIFTHFPCYEPACWSLNFMHFQTSVIRLVDRLT